MFRFLFLSFCFSSTYCAQAQQSSTTPKKDISTSINKGKVVYQTHCLSCHQIDGGGVPHLNPPLAESSWANGNVQRIIQIVLKGMSDRVPIDDEYYSNSMPAFAHLSNAQIADVLTYIRQSFGNQSSAVTATEVLAVRKKMQPKHK